MNADKFYADAYDWPIKYGPRFLMGILILIIGLWLIRLLIGIIRGHIKDAGIKIPGV